MVAPERFSDSMLVEMRQDLDTLLKAQQANTAAIAALHTKVCNLNQSTEWAQNMTKDADTIARFSTALQRIAKFLGSIIVIGGGFTWLIKHLGD